MINNIFQTKLQEAKLKELMESYKCPENVQAGAFAISAFARRKPFRTDGHFFRQTGRQPVRSLQFKPYTNSPSAIRPTKTDTAGHRIRKTVQNSKIM